VEGNGHAIKQAAERRTINLAEWQAEGVEKFGEDMHQWRFKCPVCEETQSFREFVNARIENPDAKFYFSCIGRWVKDRGCDWTLGGLFRIHKTEVIDPEGTVIAVMEWADVENKIETDDVGS
jgi:hypothetical protein